MWDKQRVGDRGTSDALGPCTSERSKKVPMFLTILEGTFFFLACAGDLQNPLKHVITRYLPHRDLAPAYKKTIQGYELWMEEGSSV